MQQQNKTYLVRYSNFKWENIGMVIGTVLTGGLSTAIYGYTHQADPNAASGVSSANLPGNGAPNDQSTQQQNTMQQPGNKVNWKAIGIGVGILAGVVGIGYFFYKQAK